MKNTLNKLPALVTLALLGASLSAAASDLSDDLRTPFEPVTNPFGRSATVPLQAPAAAELKALLEKCAYTPVNNRSALAVYNDAALRRGCEQALVPSYETDKHGQPYIGNRLAIHTADLDLTVVSWDGSDSDGGDEQAIGIYDQAGFRVARYTGLFVDGNVVDGLAHAVGAELTKEAQ